MKKVFSAILLLLAIEVGTSWLIQAKRPNALGLSFSDNVVSPSITRLVENGRTIVQRSAKGRNEGGAANYPNAWSDKIYYEVTWYDILADQAYTLDFSVSASELATLDPEKNHATITIEVGPGADVLVTTAHPTVAKLIAERRGVELGELSHEEVLPVVLRELCAHSLPASDPVARELKAAHDPNDEHFKDAMRGRDYVLQHEGPVLSRCSKERDS
ncbi:hypothetical protein [Celeribacter sp.]|uniref:hypothetical protein n=1 Tax=Celeribacter sp. TaxID=1890673 RepID=UPI003A8E171A